MGAGLALRAYTVPEDGFDLDGAKRALATMTNADIYPTFAQWDQGLADELPEAEGDTPSAARQAAEKRLVECIEVLAADRRDVGIFTFDGPAGAVRVWLTGGMTWGDSPTEAFDGAEVIDLLPVPVVDALFRRGSASP